MMVTRSEIKKHALSLINNGMLLPDQRNILTWSTMTLIAVLLAAACFTLGWVAGSAQADTMIALQDQIQRVQGYGRYP